MTHSVNTSNLTGRQVKDGRNILHSPGTTHHRLLTRGLEQVLQKTTIHPVNKYGNSRDSVSELKGPAKSTSSRTHYSVVLIGFAFLGSTLLINYLTTRR